MAVHAWEKAKSVDHDLVPQTETTGSRHSTVYCVIGTNDETAAASAVATIAPLTYIAGTGEILIRSRFRPRNTGPDSWEVEVEWTPEDDPKNEEPPAPGTWHFSFTTKGGTQKIYRSLEEVCRASYSSMTNPAPELFGAIGWDGKRVNGTDIFVGKLEFQIVAYYDPSDVDVEFMIELARATGKKNSDSWLGTDPGEVLYLGADGDGDIPTQNGQRVKPIKITHSFALSENEETPQVGDITLGCDKLGWDHLDVKHEKIEDNGFVFAVPVHAYIHKIYEDLDFGQFFGFGGDE